MPTTPLFRRGDAVYLRSSAEIGRLEAFHVTSIKQSQEGRWVYRIVINKKPPHQALIGDTYDSRTAEVPLYYTEGELITACEALNIICLRFKQKVEALRLQIDTRCQEDDDTPGLNEPRWNIGDLVYYDASAKLGFIECDRIIEIFEVGIQPGSRQIKFSYKTKNIANKKLTFGEHELISWCEAANKALLALERRLASAEAKQSQLCI